MELRAFLVTSRVTFVPENYNQLVCGLAETPHIVGCIVIDNRDWSMVLQGLALVISGAGPRMGLQLLKNYFNDLLHLKQQSYEKAAKSFHLIKDLNSTEALEILRRENVDLILNARTRTIFKKNLLATPRLGCINIHHGLLPDQRGLMCDFWAHLENTPAGFSIHQMTSQLDAGAILKVVEVPTTQTNYLESIYEGSKKELVAAIEALADVAQKNAVLGHENKKTDKTLYRKNPTIWDFFRLKFKGTKI